MNIETFANQKFNGNIEESLKYLAKISYQKGEEYLKNKDQIFEIINNFSDDIKSQFLKFYGNEINKNPKRFVNDFEEGLNLGYINMSYEEVKNAKKNPYKAKLSKSMLKYLIGGTGLISIALLASSIGFDVGTLKNVALGAFSLYSSYIAMDISSNLVKFCRFKKLKTKIDKDNLEFDVQAETIIESEEKGKSL